MHEPERSEHFPAARRCHQSKEFPDFLKEVGARIPEESDVRIVMDNHATSGTAAIGA